MSTNIIPIRQLSVDMNIHHQYRGYFLMKITLNFDTDGDLRHGRPTKLIVGE